MFEDETDPDAYLYHYTTRDAALGSILPLGLLRLSPLAWTNDPREFQPWLFNLVGRPWNSDSAALAEQLQAIDDRIRSTTKLLCLTRTIPKPESEPLVWIDHPAQGWSHSRMWDQYAEAHGGVCLAFDREKLSTQMRSDLTDGVVWESSVHYANNVFFSANLAHEISYPDLERLGVEELAEEHVEKYWSALFFLKARDWESECEYRWVYRDDQPGPVFINARDALAGVMVGTRFPEGDIPLLRYLSEEFEFTTSRCSWRNGLPDAEPIGDDRR